MYKYTMYYYYTCMFEILSCTCKSSLQKMQRIGCQFANKHSPYATHYQQQNRQRVASQSENGICDGILVDSY